MTRKLKHVGINDLSSSLDLTGTPWIDNWSGRWESNPRARRFRRGKTGGVRVTPALKCDGRVNFRGTWGNVGIRDPTAVISDVLGRIAGQLRHAAKRSYVAISAGN